MRIAAIGQWLNPIVDDHLPLSLSPASFTGKRRCRVGCGQPAEDALKGIFRYFSLITPIVDIYMVQPIEVVHPVQMLFPGPTRTLSASVLRVLGEITDAKRF